MNKNSNWHLWRQNCLARISQVSLGSHSCIFYQQRGCRLGVNDTGGGVRDNNIHLWLKEFWYYFFCLNFQRLNAHNFPISVKLAESVRYNFVILCPSHWVTAPALTDLHYTDSTTATLSLSLSLALSTLYSQHIGPCVMGSNDNYKLLYKIVPPTTTLSHHHDPGFLATSGNQNIPPQFTGPQQSTVDEPVQENSERKKLKTLTLTHSRT